MTQEPSPNDPPVGRPPDVPVPPHDPPPAELMQRVLDGLKGNG